MGRRVRRAMVIGTAVAATAAIGGTALAHESSTVGDSFLGDFASHLGVSPAKVREPVPGDRDRPDRAAVKAGRLTARRPTESRPVSSTHPGGPFVFGGPRGGFDHGRSEHRGPFDHHRGRSATARRRSIRREVLGAPRTRSTTSLASGKTLAQIAKANGKTTSGLEGR